MKKQAAPGRPVQVHVLGPLHELLMLLAANVGAVESRRRAYAAIAANGLSTLPASPDSLKIRMIYTANSLSANHINFPVLCPLQIILSTLPIITHKNPNPA